MGMQLIETIEVTDTSAPLYLEFANIDQDGVDLLVTLSARAASGTPQYRSNYLWLNGLSSGFSAIRLSGNGSSTSSTSASNSYAPTMTGTSATASTFANAQYYISNYTSSENKAIALDSVTENNGTTVFMLIDAYQWANTDAITNVKIGGSTTFAQYSTASLYKITAD